PLSHRALRPQLDALGHRSSASLSLGLRVSRTVVGVYRAGAQSARSAAVLSSIFRHCRRTNLPLPTGVHAAGAPTDQVGRPVADRNLSADHPLLLPSRAPSRAQPAGLPLFRAGSARLQRLLALRSPEPWLRHLALSPVGHRRADSPHAGLRHAE